jgi:ubiquinone/menaquinone biosynthesis C-methylase UbiE
MQRRELHGDVLEIGCGSGAMAGEMLRRFPAVRVTATDYDRSMVCAAVERLTPFGNRAAVLRADATALPFRDETFDGVVTFIMLHHVIDWEGALREAARVLRPGGSWRAMTSSATAPAHSSTARNTGRVGCVSRSSARNSMGCP